MSIEVCIIPRKVVSGGFRSLVTIPQFVLPCFGVQLFINSFSEHDFSCICTVIKMHTSEVSGFSGMKWKCINCEI